TNAKLKQFNNEIYGIFTIAIGLILLVTIYGNSVGKFGSLLKFTLKGFFSSTVVILPFLTILFGVFIFINKSILKENRAILFYSLIFISFTIFKSLSNYDAIGSINA